MSPKPCEENKLLLSIVTGAITVPHDCSVRFYVQMALALGPNPFCKCSEPIEKHVFHNSGIRQHTTQTVLQHCCLNRFL